MAVSLLLATFRKIPVMSVKYANDVILQELVQILIIQPFEELSVCMNLWI